MRVKMFNIWNSEISKGCRLSRVPGETFNEQSAVFRSSLFLHVLIVIGTPPRQVDRPLSGPPEMSPCHRFLDGTSLVGNVITEVSQQPKEWYYEPSPEGEKRRIPSISI